MRIPQSFRRRSGSEANEIKELIKSAKRRVKRYEYVEASEAAQKAFDKDKNDNDAKELLETTKKQAELTVMLDDATKSMKGKDWNSLADQLSEILKILELDAHDEESAHLRYRFFDLTAEQARNDQDWEVLKEQAEWIKNLKGYSSEAEVYDDIAEREILVGKLLAGAREAEKLGNWKKASRLAQRYLNHYPEYREAGLHPGAAVIQEAKAIQEKSANSLLIARAISDANDARARLDWPAVRKKSQDILALDIGNSEGSALQSAALRALGPDDEPANLLSAVQKALPILPAIGLFAGLLVFLGRLYLESYYSFFGVPASALEFEVQDYTFGSFPIVLFMLVMAVSVTFYKRGVRAGWLGILFRSALRRWMEYIWLFVQRQKNTADDLRIERASDHRRPGKPPTQITLKGVLMQSRDFLGLYLIPPAIGLIVLLIVLFSVVVFILAADLALGANLMGKDLPNIPGLRGLIAGSLISVGALLLISIFESGVSSTIKAWVAPAVLVLVTVFAVPSVTYFMAKDQAQADLNSSSSSRFSSLPTAIFSSPESLGDGLAEPSNCSSGESRPDCYKTPKLRVVLMNNQTAYVLLDTKPVDNPGVEPPGKPTDKPLELYAIPLEDVTSIRYISHSSRRTDSKETVGSTGK